MQGVRGTAGAETQTSHSGSKKATSLKVYQERSSMRGIERALGLSRQSFSRWLIAHIQALPPFRQSVLPAEAEDVLELDELWSFVQRKAQKRWLWVALNRRTRQIVAFVIGDRSAQTCRKLWQRIAYEYRQGCSYSDFWQAYEQLVALGFDKHLI